MSTKRDKLSLPDPKDRRIADLEAQLVQAQAIIQKANAGIQYHVLGNYRSLA